MAYQQQQQASNYAHPQQQYQAAGRPSQRQQQQQYQGYDDHYDQQYYDHGYDQQGQEQWGNGHYDQQGNWGNGQQHDGYQDMNAGYRQAPPNQRRAPPPQQLSQQQQYYQEDAYNNPYYEQSPPPQNQARRPPPQNPRAQQQAYNEPPQQRQDPRGRGAGRGDGPPHQGRGGMRAPGLDRSLLNMPAPKSLPQDNPFPTFPTQKPNQGAHQTAIDQGMAQMNISDNGPQAATRGPPGRGQPIAQQNRAMPQPRPGVNARQDSGNFESQNQRQASNRMPPGQRPSPANVDTSRGQLPHRVSDPMSPSRRAFGPNTQRSVTMPQSLPNGGQAGGYDGYQDFANPGAAPGYYGPGSPTYVPPRPSTAGGVRQNGPPIQHGQRPPMPQMPSQQQHSRPQQQYPPQNQQQAPNQYQQAQADEQEGLNTFYDDYYGEPDRKSLNSAIDMPDFDAIPETDNKHRRGDSIDKHLSPNYNKPAYAPAASAGPNGASQGQMLRSRSQPDLNGQYANAAHQVAPDAPPMPGLPRANTGFAGPNGLPNASRARGPPQRGMTTDADARTKNKNREKFTQEAYKIIKKLVSAGSPDAMFYLADCYGQGLLGLQVDTKEAFTLYQSAAKGGHAASAYRTAVCCEMGHEEGGGTKKDPVKAVQWYRRAATLGDTPAMYKMGMILLKGLLGQQKNVGEAITMLKRAAERADRDNPHALHELALIYEAQTGSERAIRDEAYSLRLFRQAADLGYKFSQFRLGQAYEYGLLGCPIDARTSIAWYTKAAAQEEHQSELALSGWYLTGTSGILEQSDTEAFLWARKAACAEPPLPKALFAMGYFTEVGIGCPRSLDEAKRWYGRAAAYKFPKAQERLEELKRGGSKVQMKRERLSRTNQKQQEENCVVM
ncbi:conserved hypothetical protein [Pyrenophora tritici-repentis Pt-1C-BFP]|uniref:TPR repeat, SEL1 subfamily n=1 Tax=Pyrenophora tritici-repentis (strain Pt-1C-BFP) TaxID=426418 RepID=B2W7C6_PYRTR|nr:uncharacterized protein PTRG_05714 [Pyrenophora tritici-repentis Pt-1C-BFP]EDU48634.1 conserved hypothetical protein [Pyrenophora tritici-repentis Pt-1C-BFP]